MLHSALDAEPGSEATCQSLLGLKVRRRRISIGCGNHRDGKSRGGGRNLGTRFGTFDSTSDDRRQMVGLRGCILLFAGVFMPILSVPIAGNVNIFEMVKATAYSSSSCRWSAWCSQLPGGVAGYGFLVGCHCFCPSIYRISKNLKLTTWAFCLDLYWQLAVCRMHHRRDAPLRCRVHWGCATNPVWR